jgi:hypothetical protein
LIYKINLKFWPKIEMDTTWRGRGAVGADRETEMSGWSEDEKLRFIYEMLSIMGEQQQQEVEDIQQISATVAEIGHLIPATSEMSNPCAPRPLGDSNGTMGTQLVRSFEFCSPSVPSSSSVLFL